MTSRLGDVVVDCTSPRGLAEFWCAALGYVVTEEREDYVEIGPPAVDDGALLAAMRAGPVPAYVGFQRVQEPHTTKNRLHLDLTPIDSSRDEEVERLLALGATRADVGQGEGRSWVVLADPEGNEFCVLRSLAPGHFELPAP